MYTYHGFKHHTLPFFGSLSLCVDKFKKKRRKWTNKRSHDRSLFYLNILSTFIENFYRMNYHFHSVFTICLHLGIVSVNYFSFKL